MTSRDNAINNYKISMTIKDNAIKGKLCIKFESPEI